MKKSTIAIVRKYGKKRCIQAAKLHAQGDGAYTIGYDMGYNTNTADALINAGKDIKNNL